MLSSADQDVVRRAVLPGLATLLDPEQFLQAVRTSMPHLEVQSTGRTARAADYDLDSCVVLYEVATLDGPTQLWGKTFRFEDFGKAARASGTRNPADRGVLADRAILLGVLPDDLELDLLPVFERGYVSRRDFFSMLPPSHPTLWDADLQIMRYKPGRRFVARLGEPPNSTLVKIYDAKRFQKSQRNADVIRSRGALRVPRCLGSSIDHRALVF